MNKMLDVKANKFSESHMSDASSPSKLVSKNRLALSQCKKDGSFNSRLEALNSGQDKKSAYTNVMGTNSKAFFPSGKGLPSENIEAHFPDLPENTSELEGKYTTNRPKSFNAKQMHLKEITSKRLQSH